MEARTTIAGAASPETPLEPPRGPYSEQGVSDAYSRARDATLQAKQRVSAAGERVAELANDITEQARTATTSAVHLLQEKSTTVAEKGREFGTFATEKAKSTAEVVENVTIESGKRAQKAVSDIAANTDRELSKFYFVRRFEYLTGVPKVYTASLLFILMALTFYFNIGAHFLTNVIGLYPAIHALSVPQLTSPGVREKETKKWITYLVAYSLFNLVEDDVWEELLLKVVPLWYFGKLGILVWLGHPRFEGAIALYDGLIHPLLVGSSAQVTSNTGPSSSDKNQPLENEAEYARPIMGVPEHPTGPFPTKGLRLRQTTQVGREE
ncbi:hypothetical protein M427DRAFT_131737 [Gonapodya prolifera JEL478]|uniref:Protein YOP1 n=1 Tax=Gonapodya prolifera (strain JEL478) TaxID=1344416 RepID=A0A139ASR7_GONPJ|nr:hypothetical protein M427DRAFT_131737 [Gonapodya prolifera JEL478]|eukprot:KXS19749.1 hypothetical protein M427DRAFT_131737 [Gonapodya prolifera JEL478]